MKLSLSYFLLKSSFLVLILASLPLKYSIPLCFLLTWIYQYVIAFIFRVHPMPSLDMLCFAGDDTCQANVLSYTQMETYKYEQGKERIRGFIKDKQKLRYRVKEILGDYYYEEMPIDWVLECVVSKIPEDCKDQTDIDKFIAKVINEKLPLDKP